MESANSVAAGPRTNRCRDLRAAAPDRFGLRGGSRSRGESAANLTLEQVHFRLPRFGGNCIPRLNMAAGQPSHAEERMHGTRRRRTDRKLDQQVGRSQSGGTGSRRSGPVLRKRPGALAMARGNAPGGPPPPARDVKRRKSGTQEEGRRGREPGSRRPGSRRGADHPWSLPRGSRKPGAQFPERTEWTFPLLNQKRQNVLNGNRTQTGREGLEATSTGAGALREGRLPPSVARSMAGCVARWPGPVTSHRLVESAREATARKGGESSAGLGIASRQAAGGGGSRGRVGSPAEGSRREPPVAVPTSP
jgi:hypothetical protein